MGASSWSHVAPYDVDAATSLRRLHERLLREGRFYWYWDAGYPDVEARPRPSTVTELWNSEGFWDRGTGTVLDIMQAVDTADAPRWDNHADDFSTVRPLAQERVRHYFGTGRPSRAQFEAVSGDPGNTRHLDFFDEDYMRWTGHYVLLYEDGAPTEIGFWGWSGD
jgi:hypothetical protein